MHVHAAVIADCYRQLLQGFVSTVGTERFVHVARRPEKKFSVNSSLRISEEEELCAEV